MMYKLNKDAIESLKEKFNLTGTAISLMVTDGNSAAWYHNRTCAGRKTLATEHEIERLCQILRCEVSDIADLVADEEVRKEPDLADEVLDNRTTNELLEAILEKLTDIAEPWSKG